MADRKARSVVMKLPITATIFDLKKSLDKESEKANPTVIQDLGSGNFLVEFEEKEQAEEFIDSGFDFDTIHVECRPPHGYYVNVSILGLPAYIADDDVHNALSEFGEIKSEIIRLKYKRDHELAGLENGNRLVRIVLTKPSIPYSLKIDGEWCRIIHNDQRRVCSNCHELGHSRRKCPEMICRVCGEQGHLSYDCTQEFSQARDETEQRSDENVNTEPPPANTEENPEGHSPTVDPPPTSVSSDIATPTEEEIPLDLDPETNADAEEMEQDNDRRTGVKRNLPTDSDSDQSKSQPQPQRRQRMKPQPNLEKARKKRGKDAPSSSGD